MQRPTERAPHRPENVKQQGDIKNIGIVLPFTPLFDIVQPFSVWLSSFVYSELLLFKKTAVFTKLLL